MKTNEHGELVNRTGIGAKWVSPLSLPLQRTS
jgi:hypothetical protein